MGLTFAAGAYIDQGNPSSGLLNLATATVGVWFRRNGTPAGALPVFFTKHSGTASAEGWMFLLDNTGGVNQGKLVLLAYSSAAVNALAFAASPATSFDGRWHLASANLQVANGAANDLYFDGAGKGSANSAVAWDMNGVSVRFARSPDAFWNSWDGSLAHGFIYRETLTDAEHYALGCGISPLLIRPHALVAYYPMARENDPIQTNLIRWPGSIMDPATTSGTITRADTDLLPVEPNNDFDNGWWLGSVSAPARRRHYFPIRSGRR